MHIMHVLEHHISELQHLHATGFSYWLGKECHF